jgi:hypothetical protein
MRTKPSEYHGNFVIECRSGKLAQARLQRKIKGQDQPALPALAPAGVGGPCSPTGVATFFAVLGAAHEAKPAKGMAPRSRLAHRKKISYTEPDYPNPAVGIGFVVACRLGGWLPIISPKRPV